MMSDSAKTLVDLREEGSRARWRGQKWKIFFPQKKNVDVRWEVVGVGCAKQLTWLLLLKD